MDPAAVASFEQLVRALMSPDNETRGAAERTFNQAKEQPDTLFACLITLLRTSHDTQVRQLCAVLARRVASSFAPVPAAAGGGGAGTDLQQQQQARTTTTKLIARLSPGLLEQFKAELLAALEVEPERSLRKKISDAVSQLAWECAEASSAAHAQAAIAAQQAGQPEPPPPPPLGWEGLLPFVLRCATSGNAGLHEAAMHILAELAGPLARPALRDARPTLQQTLARSLAEGESTAVRVAAVQAVAAVVQALGSAAERAPYAELVPHMLAVVSTALNASAEDEARDALETFVELSENCPRFLKPHASALVHALLAVASAAQLDEPTRHLAFECMLTLAEAAPAIVKKIDGFPAAVLPLALRMMLEVEGDTPAEVAEWETAAGENEEDASVSDYDVGSEALDRFSIALGGKACLPVLLERIGQLAASANWKERHAALIAISQAGEGCAKQLSKQLGSVVQMVVANLQDPHPRVRWAAVNTIGQMATDFGPALQRQFHALLVPPLIATMRDGSARVQGHAASAVINFCEHCARPTLEPYLEPLLTQLLELLRSGVRHVQEQAVTAVASVADVVEGAFSQYYETFVPGLLAILQANQGPEYRLLQGKAMECVSLIGLAVGRETFAPHAAAVMEAMIHAQSRAGGGGGGGGGAPEDDAQMAFMLQASARICKCLGEGFVPYLPHVLPPLLASAQVDPELSVTDADEAVAAPEEDEEGVESVEVTIPGVGNKRISIRTAALEEKATACTMLAAYAAELKGGFFPHVGAVLPVLAELVGFDYHEEVRSAAAGGLPALVEATALAEGAGAPNASAELTRQTLGFALAKLLEQIGDEDDTATLSSLVDALSSLVELGETHASCAQAPEQIGAAAKALGAAATESLDRRRDAAAAAAAERGADEEEEEDDGADVEEESLLSTIVECVGRYIKVYRSAFLPHLNEHLMGVVQTLLPPDRTPNDRTAALCVFDDIAEHCSADGGSAPYIGPALPLLLRYATDAAAEVRQAACYGLGVLAEHARGALADAAVLEAAQTLVGVVQAPDARNEDNESATDNAVSALGKLLLHRAPVVSAEALLPIFLGYLPVRADLLEAQVVHAQLCTLAETRGAELLGAGGERAHAVATQLLYIATAVDSGAADARTRARAAALLAALRSQPATAQIVGALEQALEPADAAKLRAALEAGAQQQQHGGGGAS